nr:HYR domain-containing protein [Gramella oceanisediminis]
MIWKTTTSKISEKLNFGVRLASRSPMFAILLIFLLLGSLDLKAQTTTECDIIETGCPPDDLYEPCGNVTVNDVLGNYITWTAPDYSLECGDGNTYQYQISFDLPEGQEECWEFYKVQRVGTGSGVLRLWNSDGNASGIAEVTTPSFYMDDVVNASMDIFAETGQDFKVDVFLKDATGATSGVLTSFNVNGNGQLTEYDFSIDPAGFTNSDGKVFRLYFEFSAINGTKLSNKNYIEFITIDAGLFGSACAAEANFAVVSTHSPGDFFPVGTTTVTYTATCNGCAPVIQETCSFDVTVNPVPEAPVTTRTTLEECAQDPIQTLNANDGLADPTNVVWYDAAQEGNVVESPILNSIGSVTYYAARVIDGCASLERTAVTLTLNEVPANPDIDSTTNTTCDLNNGSFSFSLVNGLTYTITDSNNNNLSHSNGTVSNLAVGTYYVTASSTNCTSETTEVVIEATPDTEDPSLIVASAISQNTDAGVCSAVVSVPDATFSDNCDGSSLSYTFSGATTGSGNGQVGNATFNKGLTTITYTVTDAAGNEVSATVEVTITDNEDPEITAAASFSESTDPGLCTAEVSVPNASFDDNCEATLTYELSGATTGSGNGQVGSVQLNKGVTTITYTVSDEAGNTAQASLDVTVNDNEDPTINPSENIIQDADAGSCTASVMVPDASFDDNCPDATISYEFSGATSGSGNGQVGTKTFNLGTTTIQYTVIDEAGNTTTASLDVTINDEEAPEITVGSDITETTDEGLCSAAIAIPDASFDDNCSGSSLAYTFTGATTGSGNGQVGTASFNKGTTQINYTVTDAAGNTATASITVTVSDDEAPVVESMGDIDVETDAGVCGAVVNFGMIGATDNCGVSSVEVIEGLPSGSVFPVGTTTVTWEVTDEAGNSTTTSFTVTVTDNEAPVITCPGGRNVPTMEGEDYAIVNFDDAVASDNCDVSVTQTKGAPSGSQFSLGTHEIEFTATDENGNTSVCSFTINVTDSEAPVINCPSDITMNSDNGLCGAIVTFDTPEATDNSGNVTVTQTAGLPSGSEFPVGTTLITFEASDEDGNSVSCSFNVRVTDNEAPVINCPDDITLGSEEGSCSASLANIELGMATATDNCDGEITITNNAPSVFPLGETIVTWTARDEAGNTTQCEQTVTIEDREAPSITNCAPDRTISADAGICSASEVDLGTVTATDNCSGELTITNDAPEVFELGETIVTWTVTDLAGNFSTCTQTIIVEDTEDPVITSCPATVTVSSDEGLCSASNVDLGNLEATDNCDTNLEITNNAPSVFELGETIVTWTVTDESGNETTCTQTVIVEDNEAPVVENMENIEVNNDAGECGAVVNFNMIGATDNCEIESVRVIEGFESGAMFPVGTTQVTWEVTDASGNSTTASFNVTVNDTEAPMITTCPADLTIDADAGMCTASEVNLGSLVASDNCSGDLTITNDAPEVFNAGETVVTWTVTDVAGNSSTCTQTVNVLDNEAPVITSCPATVTVSSDEGLCSASGVDLGELTVTDNCNADLEISNNAPSVFELGETIVTWTVTDDAGNETTCTQTVIVEDTEAPVVETMGDIEMTTDAGECGAVVNFNMIGATDNCEIASVEVIEGFESGSLFPIGTTEVTWEVTDASGNTTTTSFTVTVIDDETPVLSCPGDMTVATEEGESYAIVTFDPASVTDNCNATVEQTKGPASGSQFAIGEYEIEFTATDDSGNTSVCTFSITVTDGEPPVISCPADINMDSDEGLCGAVVNFELPVASDNSGEVTLVQTGGPASGEVFPVGTTTVTFTATDADNNSVSCSFDVTVNDAEAPAISCPADITIGSETDMCSASLENIELGMATATDNYDEEITITNNAPEVFPLGTTEVVWTATDAAGNSSSCTQLVTVEDNQAPVITECAAPVSVSADAGICSAAEVNLGSLMATDNCDTQLSITNNAPEVFELGETIVTWTVEDNAGNTTTCTQTVTVTDDEAPVITECPASVTVAADAGLCSASEVDLGMLTASDNCDSEVNITNDAPEVFELGDTVVTWTVTDEAGNSSSCTQTVTVIDDQAPIVEEMDDISVDTDPGSCGVIVEFGMIGADDNCELTSVEVTEGLTSGSEFPVGTTTVTWTATDASGNTTTSSFTVTVTDTEAPVVSCPEGLTVSTMEGEDYAIVDFAPATATDNCEVSVEQTAGPVSGSQFPLGTTTVTFTATDAAGNTTECSFSITVEDTEAPNLSCPDDMEMGVDAGVCGAVVEFEMPAVSDNSGNVELVQTGGPASGEEFPVGTTTVSFTATDEAGNTATCSFTVTINDDEAPEIEQKDDITVNTDAGSCGAVVDYTAPVASDNCGIESLVLTDGLNSGSEFPIGETMITYVATDSNGNTATSSFTVTVVDNEAPAIECPENIDLIVEIGTTSAIVEYDAVITSDNCEGTTVELIEGFASGEEFPLGSTTVTYRVTDAAGNTAECSFIVNIAEENLPNPPAAPVANISVEATCADPFGTITVDTQEGLTYSIDGENYQESGVFDMLEPGTYEVTARDEFGQVSGVTVITIDEPVAQEINVAPDPNLCVTNGVFDLFDLLQGEVDESGTWEDTDNTGALDSGFIDTEEMELGTYIFTYVIEGTCPSTTEVLVTINDDCVVLPCTLNDIRESISKAVTPNGDNRNDFFEVDLDTDCGFTYDLKIFNRWGAKVFEAQNYQNNWDGYSESSFTSSNQLPSGTYYYVLEIRNSEFEPIQGYIYLGTK